jgi:phospholipase/carboxylesterase
MTIQSNGPHQGQPVLAVGAPLDRAQAALILVHGRGATAESILELAGELDQAGFAYLAPQAAGNTWYPQRFTAPLAQNEPYLSSALGMLGYLLAQVQAAGIPAERTILLGFSQGACLALEFGARNARRYGGLVGLSGGLIGPDDTPRDYPGTLDGTPVFLGCSDVDSHIPAARVEHSAEVLRRLGGDVTLRLYPGMGHTVNEDEIAFVRGMLAALIAA